MLEHLTKEHNGHALVCMFETTIMCAPSMVSSRCQTVVASACMWGFVLVVVINVRSDMCSKWLRAKQALNQAMHMLVNLTCVES